MAFGIGFGAFAQGLSSGLRAGVSLGNALEKGQQKRAMRTAIGEAKQDYDKDIADRVMTQAGQQQADAPGIGTFDAEAATKKAREATPFVDYLYNQKMPGIIDSMVQAGDLDGAEKMRKWAADGKERKFMEGFGKVLAAGYAGKSSGDYSDFADQSMSLFNSGNYGMSITGYDLVKDGDGNTTGITYKIKNGDGKEVSHTFNSMDEASQFIASEANPTSRFKQWVAERDAATKLKADITKEKMKAAIGLGKDTAIENVRQQNRIDLDDHKTENDMWKESAKGKNEKVQQQRVAEYKAQALKEAGYSDDKIKEMMPDILGVSSYRKGASPQERVRMTRNMLMSSDYEFARKSPEEQDAIIRRMIEADDKIAADLNQNNGDTAPAQPAQKPRMNVFR